MGSIDQDRKAQCSRCRTTSIVPPYTRNIRCAVCHHVMYVGRDPVRHAFGFMKSMVGNLSNSLHGQGSNSGENPLVYIPTSYPRVFGKKRALLIGVSYLSTEAELQGTVNDVKSMAYVLSVKFGFPKECMLVLTEEEQDHNRIPTKVNMRAAMRWLVSGCSVGDSLVFYFAGHGNQVPDRDNDEVDGYDEALCPLDYEDNGMILDDEINATIVRSLPFGVKLNALVDACNSGTALDLPYLCGISRRGKWQWEDHSAPSGEYKGTNGGLAILISGCDDHQKSNENPDFMGSASAGAMTHSFLQAMMSGHGTTYGRLMTAMRTTIREKGSGFRFSGPIASLIRKVVSFRPSQARLHFFISF